MFDWFWELLYGISKSIFNLIDGLMECANKLCGIDPITVEGEQVGFMDFLLRNDRVMLGFKVSALVGFLLVGIFAVFAIIRSIVSEKAGTTPLGVLVRTGKTMLMFLFVPVCMFVLIYFTNIFMNALYAATLGGNTNGLGNFLCGAFSHSARLGGTPENFYTLPEFDYRNTSTVASFIDLSDFDYFFSWVAGLCILVSLASALLMFVDRAISIVLLYIVAPISLSTNVIDDGAHFKLWRDQILVKFLTGYGCILALNIYALIISLISSDSVVFFPDSSFLNNLMKIAFFIGGAVSMQRAMALVGNLVSAGAGSNEMRDNAIAKGGFIRGARMLGKALVSPYTATRATSNFIRDWANTGFGATVGSRLGWRSNRDYGIKSETQRQNEMQSKAREHQQLAGFIGDRVASAIGGRPGGGNGGGDRPGGNGGGDHSSGNGGKPSAPKNDLVDNAISNSISNAGNDPDSNKKK